MSNKITGLSSPWMPWWNISDEEDNEELAEEIKEEVEVKRKDDFKEEKSDLSQFEKEKRDESEKSEKSAVILKTLEEVREAEADLQEVLLGKKPAKPPQEEALKKLQEETCCLERALKYEQAEKDRLNIIIDHLREQVADLKKSQKEYETNNRDLKTNLHQHKKTISKLHRDLELSSMQHEKEKALLTLENQRLSSEKQILQNELVSLLQEKQLAQKQLEEEKEARTGLEKAVKKEKSQFCKGCQKLQKKEKELSEKSGFQKQAPPGLRGSSKSKEDLLYDMQTLKMENLNLIAKLEEMESQYNRIKTKQSVFNQHEHKLEDVADELKAWPSKGKTRQTEPEMALKEKKTLTSELKQTVGAVKKQHGGASTKHAETLEEQQKLAEAAQKNQDSYSRFPQQNMEGVQLRHVSGTEHKIALDQSTKALYNLQKAYFNLVKKNSDVNDDYKELLKTHTALQIKYNKLENLRSHETTWKISNQMRQ